MKTKQEIQRRLALLNTDIARYPAWGAALTEMNEEREELEAQLAAIRRAEEREAKMTPHSDQPQPLPSRVLVLQEGAKLTSGDRDTEYGDPKINMACAAELKGVFWRYQSGYSTRPISSAEREAIDMTLTKLSRIACGPKPKRDTYVDGATYLAIAWECCEAAQREEELLK